MLPGKRTILFRGGSTFIFDMLSSNPRVAVARASSGTLFDVTGTLQTAGANVARYTYSPSTVGKLLGLLNEPQRTNSIRNPRAEGAVAGSPGTMPPNWAVAAPTGLTRTISLSVVNGIQYIDINWTGTTTSSAPITIQSETNSAIPAVSGQSWSSSSYAKVVVDDPNVVGWNHAVQGLTTTPTISESFNASFQATRLTLSRLVQNVALVSATTATIRQQIGTIGAISSGVVINVTLRIGAPKLELGAFATSDTLPPVGTPAAATRAADVLTAFVPSGNYTMTVIAASGVSYTAAVTVTGGVWTFAWPAAAVTAGETIVQRVTLRPA